MPVLLGYYIGAPFRRFLRLERCLTGAPLETQKPDPDVRPPLKTAGTEDRVAALVPPPCCRRNEMRTRVLHPHCASRYHFPGRLPCSQTPCGQQDTLPFAPPNSRQTMKLRNVRDILRRKHLSLRSPSIVAMEPPVFPLEIFELIIDSVVGVEALCSCALVCRPWCLRARRNIFRVVSLYENKYKDTFEDSEGATRLHLRWKSVRVACLVSLIQDVSIAWEFAGTLVPCASSFTRLRRLKLYSSDVGYRYPGAPEIQSASQLLRALPISHLEISTSYFATFQLFLSLWDTSYPSLKHLKISLISIQDMHSRFRSVIIDQ
ncbi:uncharacterized protein ARMOST_15747 [Armillaria ostoyae]|uniref:F-box domain-containing protein n=1 Tax=Armillaria ostoyae TaxID=47428 RepID=A0A284RU84_ARMOS|nr:uncharacterized protein ARMOST_15747 [Armillaria ostoyae]